MTTPPGEGPKELADMPHLSDVQATDALLDRLGARTPADDDLADPIVAELAALAQFADASSVPPPGIDRLIEVLDGRPLFMFDRGTAAVDEADEPIDLGDVRPAARMIDLTRPARTTAAASVTEGANDSGDSLDDERADERELVGVAARTADGADADSVQDDSELGRARLLRLARRPVTKAGWQGALQQMALPAASVVALLALGGGVSAVVTGDPMSPVYGVSKVASAFGGDSDEKKITSVKDDISAAQSAAQNNNYSSAKNWVESAKDHLSDVPDEHKDELQVQIDQVEKDLTSAAPTVAATPTPGVTSSPQPTVDTTPTPSTPVETTPGTPPVTITPDDPASTSPDSGSGATAEGAVQP